MNNDSMDERLNSVAQQAVRSAVKGLPEDTLSMAWRSALNERLLAEAAPQSKKRGFAWYLRPALGLGLACSLALIATFHSAGLSAKPAVASHGSGGLEAALVNLHRQSALAFDVAGVGLNPVEMVSNDSQDSAPSASISAPRWSEDDLDSL